MYRKDKIKGIIALILFGMIGITYLIWGDGIEIKISSAGAVIIWFGTMFFLNKKGPKE